MSDHTSTSISSSHPECSMCISTHFRSFRYVEVTFYKSSTHDLSPTTSQECHQLRPQHSDPNGQGTSAPHVSASVKCQAEGGGRKRRHSEGASVRPTLAIHTENGYVRSRRNSCLMFLHRLRQSEQQNKRLHPTQEDVPILM